MICIVSSYIRIDGGYLLPTITYYYYFFLLLPFRSQFRAYIYDAQEFARMHNT